MVLSTVQIRPRASMAENVVYVERYTVPKEHRHEILRELHENGPMKPWTLQSRVNAPHKAMKQLVLDREIRINADADVALPRR